MGWLSRRMDEYNETKYYYKIGCEVVGLPSTTIGLQGTIERAERVRAGKKEHARRQAAASQQRARQIGEVASDAALGAAYREGKAQRGRDVQFDSHGVKVLVKNGYSRKYNRYTTDIILIDPGRPGQHLHAVLDENGGEIHQAWTKNHG